MWALGQVGRRREGTLASDCFCFLYETGSKSSLRE